MSKMDEIAYIGGLDVVETTIGANGYPQNIKKAIVGFDEWEYAVSVAERYGLRITTLHKRDGWQLWERNGNTTFEPLKPTEEWYGDNYKFYQGEDTQTFFHNEMKPVLSDIDSYEELLSFIDEKRDVIKQIERADENEWVVLREGEHYETISKECLSWSHDTHHYVIALIED